MPASLSITAALLGLLLGVAGAAAGDLSGTARATFVVHCYDVGAHALQGRPGVLTVERGWSGSREIDRVVYNPEKVSIVQLEGWLKDSGTYVSTLEPSINTEPVKEVRQ